MDLQIDDFYKDVAKSLLQLYRAFPCKTTLYVSDLIGHQEPDEFGLPSARHAHCFASFIWLADEGYIRHEGRIRQDALDQVCLTETAFKRLVARIEPLPESLQALPTATQRSLGSLANQIHQALQDEDSELIAQWVQRFFKVQSI